MKPQRILRTQRGNQIVWIKVYGGASRRVRVALLRWFARRLGANALLAPIPLNGRAALAVERAMIERLQALGVTVPAIIETRDGALVLSDLGPTLSWCCQASSNPYEREILIAAGFAALADLHRRGGYASQAFARNLAYRDGVVGFIDLEEDPITVMPLTSAQVRDTLFYVYSTVRFLHDDLPRYRRLMDAHLREEPAEVCAEFLDTVRRLRWLAPCSRFFWGRARAIRLTLENLGEAARKHAQPILYDSP